ncbi:6-phosphogluconolactonase [Terrihabitans soli]|uniref:6-phosphogluconolactonase n=1 Tax=Terrihabitans soli TaxID=708113 RepID=A0A6S6QWS9_9HYPH|nr:6-phosphogluconolactonase [Terrihabitans soli]BCJ91490.1 6-phosphogluconolactonase [Terrihabitans soli]
MEAAELKIFPDKDALARGAADFIAARVLDNPGRVALCLTGGSTPEGMYKVLATKPLPWERIHIFWGDERFVPAGDPLSNARMTMRALLDKVPVPDAHIHPIPTETSGPEESAALYEKALKSFYGAEVLDPSKPLFDVVLNGMGDDGHTASLFPGAPQLNERLRWVVAAEPGMEPRVKRVTLTFPVLESCRSSLFLVAGAGKAAMLKKVLAGEDFPAARLKPRGDLSWFVDTAAVS